MLDPVKPYDQAPAAEFWPSYLRGQAYLQLKDGGSASAEFRSILNHRGAALTSPLYPLAHLGLARASMLAGDAVAARNAYERFFALWERADSSLEPVQEARREYSRIQ